MQNMPRINQTHSLEASSIRGLGTVGTIKSVADVGGLSTGEQTGVILMLVLGSIMQALANKAVEAVIVALLLLFVGRLVIALVFPSRKAEMRAFLLMFAVCVFVGGLAQIYSLAAFNRVQSMIDARVFTWEISVQPPFHTFATASQLPVPLAIIIWEQFYKVTWWLGFKYGPYTGVMVNSMVMGWVAALTVQIARELFGNDSWRLRKVGTLVAANGLFILFGALLLRDSFTTFFMTLVFWGAIRFLVRSNLRSLLIAMAIIGVSAWAMLYLRDDAFPIIFLYVFLALLFWLFKHSGAFGVMTISVFLTVLLVGGSFFSVYIQEVQTIQTYNFDKYAALANRTAAEDSLGIRFVTNQPLPIRVVLGAVTLIIQPIPLWAFFSFSRSEYHWIKGYNGLYQVYILPLVIVGGSTILQMLRKSRKKASPFLFLLVFILINMIAVSVTSKELRHLGQFMAAIVILAALPDNRKIETQKKLKKTSFFWFNMLLLTHLAWALAKVILY